ncbi:MAG: sugar transferase [Candidatus Harrisonbacteria bacterium]|nr:sugar transferase [Candidatus Harrisonbacteria bacterium]
MTRNLSTCRRFSLIIKFPPSSSRAISSEISRPRASFTTNYRSASPSLTSQRFTSVCLKKCRYRRAYDTLVVPLQRVAAFALFIAFLPLMAVIGALIALSGGFPVVHRQTRVGKYGAAFTLYKFRSMRKNAEPKGPEWASVGDPRTTFVGRILRYTHLDELPQLWNIVLGDLSFVGPRPERPEFVEQLKKEIPFFELRQLVNPGVTGWAQINYRYGASVADAYQKLQYDLYYLKNRSLLLDVAIVLKTLKLLVVKIS